MAATCEPITEIWKYLLLYLLYVFFRSKKPSTERVTSESFQVLKNDETTSPLAKNANMNTIKFVDFYGKMEENNRAKTTGQKYLWLKVILTM